MTPYMISGRNNMRVKIHEVMYDSRIFHFWKNEEADSLKNALVFQKNQSVQVLYPNGHARPHLLHLQNLATGESSPISEMISFIKIGYRIVIPYDHMGLRVGIPLSHVEIPVGCLVKFQEVVNCNNAGNNSSSISNVPWFL